MPLYEYRCSNCGETVEVLQRPEDPPPASCARCGASMVKVLSAPALQFKGSGWYVTDYARAGKQNKEGPTAKASEPGTPAAEKKSTPPKPSESSS